jgi:glycosyltransferase involved in cell wall biosynthesis
MKRKPTITIGIPTFNEEANIGKLLESILSQKKENFLLEKIIVYSDGSTDNTVSNVEIFSKKFPIVKLIKGKKRLGKAVRLNKLYKLNKSLIYITFDADIVLGNENVLEEISRKFKNKNVGLVGGCTLPCVPKSFIEKIAVTWIHVWFETRRDLNRGVTIHNHLGCASAMRAELANHIRIPTNAVSDEDYIYFMALKMGYKFEFAKKAIVYYKAASTLKDYFVQSSRVLSAKDRIAFIFGQWVYSYYQVPFKSKISALVRIYKKEPFFLPLAILLQIQILIYTKLFKQKQNLEIWNIAYSTKETNF